MTSSDELRRKRDELLARPFPLSADLPDEFDDLFTLWTDLTNRAVPAANAILEGRRVRVAEMKIPRLTRVERRLAALERQDPDIAEDYVACFRALAALIEALRDSARSGPPKG